MSSDDPKLVKTPGVLWLFIRSKQLLLLFAVLPFTSSSSTVVLLLSDDSWRSEINSKLRFGHDRAHIRAECTWRGTSQEGQWDLMYTDTRLASRGHPMLPCHVFTNPKQHKIHQDQLLTVDLVHKQNTKSNCKYVSYYHPAFVALICLIIFALTIQKLKSVSLYLTFLHSNLFSSTHAASSYLCTAPSGQMMPLLQWEHLYHAKTDRNCFPFQ